MASFEWLAFKNEILETLGEQESQTKIKKRNKRKKKIKETEPDSNLTGVQRVNSIPMTPHDNGKCTEAHPH